MATTILSDAMENASNWTGGSPTTVAGRTANAQRIVGSSGSMVYAIPSASRPTILKLDFWFRMSTVTTGTTRQLAAVRSPAGTPIVSYFMSALGSMTATLGGTTGSVVGTAGPTPTANVFHHAELYVKIGQSGTGIVRAWYDGNNWTSAGETGLNVGGAGVTQAVEIALFGNGTGAGTNDFDDFILTNEAPAGVTVKVWNGSSFVSAPVKVWNGTAFIDALAVKTWNGTAFV